MIRTGVAILTTILCATLAVPAQPSTGDYIVVDAAGTAGPTLLAVDRNAKATTLVVAPALHLVVEPRMDVGNRDLVATFNGRLSAGGSLIRITPTGQVTTLASGSTFVFPRSIELDDDGSYLLLDTLDKLHRSSGGTTTSIARIPSPFGAFDMTTDPVTGYTWMVGFGGKLANVHHRTAVVTTLFPPGLRYATGMDHDEATDTFVITIETLKQVLIVNRKLQIVSSFTTPQQNWSLRLHPETGNVHVLDGNSRIIEWTPQGVGVRSTKLPFRADFFSLEVYGSRPVSGVGSAARGTSYQLRIGFPGAAGLTYAAALSLGGIRPGVPLPDGRRIAIAADALFLLTASQGDIPGVTQGLRGTLSTTAQASATIHVSRNIPPGTRVFATAVALDPKAPSGLRIGNTWAFETR